MKNQITILSAKNNRQAIELDGKKYEFEFSENELMRSIYNNNSVTELSERTLVDDGDWSKDGMSAYLSAEWNYEDVETLISDFILTNPENLIDHLIEGAGFNNNPEGPITINCK